MNCIPEILTENCILRLPEIEDASAMMEFVNINKAYLAPWEPVRSEEYFSQQYWLKTIKNIQADYLSDKSCCLNIYLAENNKLIGMVNYSNFIRGIFHSCFLGFRIAESMQGKGLMSEVLKASINYVFDTLNLHRISANYMPGNMASAKVLERSGFIKEGVARDYLYINGKWEPHILTSLINPGWRNT